MNYFEFKNILDADPHNQTPEFLDAIKNDPRCRRAYQQAMAEERIIAAALKVPVPKSNIEHIRFSQSHQRSRQQRWLLLAASLVMMFGLGAMWFNQSNESELERFIHDALLMEPSVYMADEEIPQQELAPLFASINTAIDGELGQVRFMKLCPTLNGRGARMVMMNELNQPITVLYMPNAPVKEAINMEMDGYQGKIIALEQGSAAIISRPHESIAQVEHNISQSLRPLR